MKIETNRNEQPIDKLNGSNFRSCILTIDGNLAQVKSTKTSKAKLFLFLFGCSLFFFFIAFMAFITTPKLEDLWGKGLIIYFVFLILFIALSMFLFRVANRSHNFNLSEGIYYSDKERAKLNSFVGIQVIRKRIYGNNTNFDSYELNLVSKTNKRINIVDHSEGDYVKLEAAKLATLLNLEVSYLNCSV